MIRRFYPFKGPQPITTPRPLEWQENEANPFISTVFLDLVQQLLGGDPVGVQHTFITVLCNTPSVRLGNLSELRDSLRIQGLPHHNLVTIHWFL